MNRILKSKRISLLFTILCLLSLVIASVVWYGNPHRTKAASGLTGYWKFDEGSGTTASDTSTNGNSATLQGHATWATGRVGTSSLILDGTTGTDADVASSVIDTSQSFSVSTWVKLSSISGYQTFVSIDGSNVSGFYLQLRGDTGNFAFTRLASDSNSAAAIYSGAQTAPVVGTWYHLSGVYDATANTLTLYVNGTPQQPASYTNPWKATGHIEIGRGKFGAGPVDFTSGQLDDVRLYNLVLNGQQVQDLPTVGYWNFDENSGTTAGDSSPNGIGGTITGATWTSGKINSGLSFNGTSNSVSMGNASALNFGSSSFTIASWFNTSATNGLQRIVSKGHYGWTSGYFLSVGPYPTGNAGSIGGGVGGGTQANSLLFYTTNTFNDGQWHNAALVIDQNAKTAQVYVDGQAQAVTTQPGTCGTANNTTINISACTSLNASSSDPFSVGSYNGNNEFFNGSLDDIRTYPYALSNEAAYLLINSSIPTTLTINANQSGAQISPLLYGLMFEDINHSGDGGIYGELIQNRIFQDDPTTAVNWSVVNDTGTQGSIALDTTNPVNTVALTTSLKLSITQAGPGRVGVANSGFWGIPVQPNTTYTASFYARADSTFSGPLTVDIESNSGVIAAQATVNAITTGWQQYHVTLTTSNVTASTTNRFVISGANPGTVWFNLVSLFPPTWNNRPNGMRKDLMQLLSDMKPSFLRFPGGNFLEGNTIADHYPWQSTVGANYGLDQRPGHNDPWGYRSSDGLGLLEYLEWCDDLHMTPLLAVYAGYSLQHQVATATQLAGFVQDAVNEMHYATDPTTTSWGALRAQDGHPAAFTIPYVEIGNEDFFDSTGSYTSRYTAFYTALHAAFPTLKFIATAPVDHPTSNDCRNATTTTSSGAHVDVCDDHFYRSPQGFESDSTHYDNYNRSGPKIFVGEYASQEGQPTGDMNDALGDAAWMTGLERNSDAVIMASYAPAFVNVNAHVDWAHPNLIGYDSLNSYGSPSYYVQKLFSLYHGDVVLPTQLLGGAGLYYVTSKVSSNGTIYVKVINTTASAQSTSIVVNGANIAAQGSATVMSATSLTAANSLSNPTNVVPQLNTLSGLSSSFTYSFAPYSVTVLQLTGQ